MRYEAKLATIYLPLAILQALRLLRKIYLDSRDRDRKMKLLLKKPPFLVGLHLLNMSVAGLILSVTNWLHPRHLWST